MRILLLEDSLAIEKVVKLGLGTFPDVELKTCRSDGDFSKAVRDFAPEMVLVSDGFVGRPAASAGVAKASWKEALDGWEPERVVLLASSESSADALRVQGYGKVLRKPFKMSEFRELVEPVWLRRRGPIPPKFEQFSNNEDTVAIQGDLTQGGIDPGGVAKAAESGATMQSPAVTMDLGYFEKAQKGVGVPQQSDVIGRTSMRKLPAVAQGSVSGPGKVGPVTVTSVPPPPSAVGQSGSLPSRDAFPAGQTTLAEVCERIVEKHLNGRLAELERAAKLSVRADIESRFLKVAEGVVQSQIEAYLNSNWATVVKSVTGQVKNAALQDHSARMATDLEVMRQQLTMDLKAVAREECDNALRSWMGSFSRDVLKETAREELQKLLDSP